MLISKAHIKTCLLILGFSILSSLASATTTDYQFTTTSHFSFSAAAPELIALMGGEDALYYLSSSGSFTYTSTYSESDILVDNEENLRYSSIVNLEADFDNRHFSVSDGAVNSSYNADFFGPGTWLTIFSIVGPSNSFGYSFGDYQLTDILISNLVFDFGAEPSTHELFPSEDFLAPPRVTYEFTGPDNESHFLYAEVTISAVPVPAAAWLFGSALLGLVGLKRKK